jgi:hypothetical protein
MRVCGSDRAAARTSTACTHMCCRLAGVSTLLQRHAPRQLDAGLVRVVHKHKLAQVQLCFGRCCGCCTIDVLCGLRGGRTRAIDCRLQRACVCACRHAQPLAAAVKHGMQAACIDSRSGQRAFYSRQPNDSAWHARVSRTRTPSRRALLSRARVRACWWCCAL